ncbi:MAG: TonB-dependent receptor [Bacteroidota bacterium]
MKYTILYLLLFASGLPMLAQNASISGVIRDAENIAIPGVNIYVQELEKGTVTDVNGKFLFEDVQPGDYQLVASFIGYETQELNVNVTNGQQATIELTLQEGVDLQTVEIIGRRERGYKNTQSFIGTKSATSLIDVPQSISYVTKELALDQAAFRLNDVVKNISGVNQFSFYNDISIRGHRVSGQRNSGTLINGMRAFTSFWKQQLIPHIERVEVIKGPASALFGNASPGGTINRVTKKPLTESRQSISSTVGSFNTFRTLADFTGPMTTDKRLLYRVNVGYENSGSFRDLQFDENLIVAPSFSFLPSDRTSLNFDIVLQNSEGRLDRGQAVFGNGDLNSVPITRSLSAANDFLKEENINATVSFQHRFSDNITFNSIYMRSSYREDLLEHRTANSFAALGDGSFDEEKVAMRVFIRKRNWNNNNFNNYLNFDFNIGGLENQLLVGYDYFQQILEPGGSQLEARSYLLQNGTATNSFNLNNKDNYVLDAAGNPVTNVAHFDLTSPNANAIRDMSDYVYRTRNFNQFLQRSSGIYVQNQTKFGDFRLLLGLRQEYFADLVNYNTESEEEVKQDVLIPRIGLVYSLLPNVNLYGTYVEGYQPQTASVINDPNAGGPFDPLVSNLIEFGAKSEWFNRRLSASVAVFRLEQQGALYNANDPSRPDLLAQIGEELSQGIEFDVAGRISSNWSIVASYSFNDATITASDDESEIGRQKPNAPRHTGNLWTKYIIGAGALEGLGFGFGADFVSERFGSIVRTPEPPLFPGYELLNAAIYYRLDKFQIQMNINNLADQTHWVGGYDFIRAFPGAPRNVLMTVSYTF